jgi:hypothetical protein
MNSGRVAAIHAHGKTLLPGITVSVVVAAAAGFLSEHYHAPLMLFALLLGMALNFLSQEGPCKPGIEFAGARCCASVSRCSAFASRWCRSRRSAGSRSRW